MASADPHSRSSSIYAAPAGTDDPWTGNPYPASDPQHHEVKKAIRAAVVRRMPLAAASKVRLSDVILEESHQHHHDVILTANGDVMLSSGLADGRSLSPRFIMPVSPTAHAPPPAAAAGQQQHYTEEVLPIADITSGVVLHGGVTVWVCRRHGVIDVVDSLSFTTLHTIRIAEQLLTGDAADQLAEKEALARTSAGTLLPSKSESFSFYEDTPAYDGGGLCAETSVANIMRIRSRSMRKRERSPLEKKQQPEVLHATRICAVSARYAVAGLSDGRAQVFDCISLQAVSEAQLLPAGCAVAHILTVSCDDVERVAHIIAACDAGDGATAFCVARFTYSDVSVVAESRPDESIEPVLSRTQKGLALSALFATSDVTTLLAGDRDGALWRIDLNDLNTVSTVQLFPKAKRTGTAPATGASSDAARSASPSGTSTQRCITAIAIADVSSILVCGCSDGTVRLFDFSAANGWIPVPVHKLAKGHDAAVPVLCLRMEPSTKRCWTVGRDGSAFQFSVDPVRGFEVLASSVVQPTSTELVDFVPHHHADSMRLLSIASTGINHFWATQFIISEAEAEASVHAAAREEAFQLARNDRFARNVSAQRDRNQQRIREAVNSICNFSLLRVIRAAYWKLDKYRLMRRIFHKRELAMQLLVNAEKTSLRTVALWRWMKLRDIRLAEKQRQKSVQIIELCLARRRQRRAFIVWEEYVRRQLRQRNRRLHAATLAANISAFAQRLWMHRWLLAAQAKAFTRTLATMATAMGATRQHGLLLSYYARWQDERRRREAVEHRVAVLRDVTTLNSTALQQHYFRTWRQFGSARRTGHDQARWCGNMQRLVQRATQQRVFGAWTARAQQRILGAAQQHVDVANTLLAAAHQRHRFVQPRVDKIHRLEQLRRELAAAQAALAGTKGREAAVSQTIEALKRSDAAADSASGSGALVQDVSHGLAACQRKLQLIKGRCLNLYAELPFIEKTIERNKRNAREAAKNAYLLIQKSVSDAVAAVSRAAASSSSNALQPSPSLSPRFDAPGAWPMGQTEQEVRLTIGRIPPEQHSGIVAAIKTIGTLADFLAPNDLVAIGFDADMVNNGEHILSMHDALAGEVARRKLAASAGLK